MCVCACVCVGVCVCACVCVGVCVCAQKRTAKELAYAGLKG